MAASTNNRRGLVTDINVTPLVDIMLVLLIVVYAALLRAEALIGWFGPIPGLAVSEEDQVRLQERVASMSPAE